jgi:predicted transcriptional regulator
MMSESFFTIRIDSKVLKALKEFARKQDRSVGSVVRLAITEYLSQHTRKRKR